MLGEQLLHAACWENNCLGERFGRRADWTTTLSKVAGLFGMHTTTASQRCRRGLTSYFRAAGRRFSCRFLHCGQILQRQVCPGTMRGRGPREIVSPRYRHDLRIWGGGRRARMKSRKDWIPVSPTIAAQVISLPSWPCRRKTCGTKIQ